MNAVAVIQQWVVSLVTTAAERPEKQPRKIYGKMPDDEKSLRDRFLFRPDDKNEKRTSFQERMQSGGA